MREGNEGVGGGVECWVVGFRLRIGGFNGLGVCCIFRRFGGRVLSESSTSNSMSVLPVFDCGVLASNASF